MARTGRTGVVLAVLAGLTGAVLVFVAFHRPDPLRDTHQTPGATGATGATRDSPAPVRPLPSTPHREDDTGVGRLGTPDLVRGPVLPAASPTTISIPRLGVFSRLESLGLDGTEMEVPQDPDQAGWYRLGPTPGALGPAVIAGHVSWNKVPAVFYSLAELGPGDVVRVARRDGQVASFRVTDVGRYPKTQFPTRSVFGAIDYAGLRLITCGGDYDSGAHRYSDNVVVFARLTGTD